MNTTTKFLIILITASALAFSNVNAQESNDHDSEVPNRLSIGLMGGATMGHMNVGTEYDPTFGLNLRYAFNPKFALQTNFLFGKFTSNDADDNLLDRSFENSYAAASITSQIGLLNLMGSESERFKWYGTVGLGLLFSDVTTNLGSTVASPETVDTFRGENHSETALFATFGTGVRVNVTHRIDVFAQYDYNITNSDIVDGHRTHSRTMIDQNRRNPDSWSALTAGVQFKFGSSSKDADWHRYTPGIDMRAFNLLEARVAGLESRVDHQDSRIDQNEDHIRALQNRMDEFDEKLANLHVLIAERPSVELTMGSDILFAFDSAVVRESAKPSLAEIARALINNPDKRLSVTGHTCDIGSTTYNQGLSERRAAAVKRYLVDSGINADRITTQGRGEAQPLVPNNSEEARALNRRVEMVID
jgi:outer membrane protein OmpA-like peptidoglycan-associated protein/opacity protein-like surface antigen